MPQHASVNREHVVAYFKTVLHAPGKRSLQGPLARFFQFSAFCLGGQEILWHVAALTQRWFELLQRQKHFAIITPRVLFRFNVDRSDLPAVLASKQIGASTIVGVIKAQARRTRGEGDAALTVSGDERR